MARRRKKTKLPELRPYNPEDSLSNKLSRYAIGLGAMVGVLTFLGFKIPSEQIGLFILILIILGGIVIWIGHTFERKKQWKK